MDLQQIDFLQSVSSLLHYHRAIGIDAYPADTTLLRFLKIADIPAATLAAPRETSRTMSVVDARDERMIDIVDEVSLCTGCVLHTKRLLPVPGQGGEKPRLLLVGGWLVGQEGTTIPPGRILGQEEDVMVSRMLAAIQLPPEDAFVTNVVKCAIPSTCRPTTENIHTCFSFLLRQIIALSPEVICTMGIDATRALLKNPQPLSQLRGKFYPFALSDQTSIPVIPTYHPTFLLRNPEFKKATWEDLQSIAKLLKTM
jgi:uracil-DNA glycosylase